MLGNLIVALAGLPFMLSASSLGGNGLWRLLLLGTVQLGLPYVFYAAAIKHVTALEATLIPLSSRCSIRSGSCSRSANGPARRAIVGALLVLGAVLGRGLIMIRGRRVVSELRIDASRESLGRTLFWGDPIRRVSGSADERAMRLPGGSLTNCSFSVSRTRVVVTTI